MKPILILGGYGNFGKRIAVALTKAAVPVIIAGRDAPKRTRWRVAFATLGGEAEPKNSSLLRH